MIKEKVFDTVAGLVSKTPQKFRWPLVNGVAAFGIASGVGAVCDSPKNEEPPTLPPNVARTPENQPIVEPTVDPDRFLHFPVERKADMRLQQTWDYNFETAKQHDGIDFIKGEFDDSSTWESFDVFSSAEGEACVNPERREGLAVFIRHDRPDGRYYTYYGHLKKADKDIPQCYQTGGWNTKTKFVEAGEKIGESGSDGVFDKYGNRQTNWTHLHYALIGPNGKYLDPYDIYSTREDYPDLLFQNNLTCGENTLWLNCPANTSRAELAPTKEFASTVEPVPTEDYQRPSTVLPRTETRDQEVQRKFQEAEALSSKFIGLMLQGSPQALEEARMMQITESEMDSRPRDLYKVASLDDLQDCSRAMRAGQFTNWTVRRYEGISRINKGITEADRLNREQGLSPNDSYVIINTFTYNEYNRVLERRAGFANYELYANTALYFEDTGDDLKLAHNNLCFGIGTPIE